MKCAVSSIQTNSSCVSEVDRVRVFDPPPLIHPVCSVPRGTGRAKRINMVESLLGRVVVPIELWT